MSDKKGNEYNNTAGTNTETSPNTEKQAGTVNSKDLAGIILKMMIKRKEADQILH